MTFLNETKPSLDDALEHFGVQGMKWGVRKQATARPQNSRNVDRKRKAVKIAGGAVAVATLAVGAYAVRNQLKNHGALKVANLAFDKKVAAQNAQTLLGLLDNDRAAMAVINNRADFGILRR